MDPTYILLALLSASLLCVSVAFVRVIRRSARSGDRHEGKPPSFGQPHEQSEGGEGEGLGTAGVVADGSPIAGMDSGYRVKTMLGTVVFRNSLAAGRFGDWLTAQYYTRRRSGRYVKLKSKLPGEKGIDGVYWRYLESKADCIELVVVENKINTSRLSPDQLSIGWVVSRCRSMLKTGDTELVRTACMLLNALHYPEQTRHKITRLLITHDLVSGVSDRHHVDEDGRKSNRHGRWRNHDRVRRSLERKMAKKEIWLDVKP